MPSNTVCGWKGRRIKKGNISNQVWVWARVLYPYNHHHGNSTWGLPVGWSKFWWIEFDLGRRFFLCKLLLFIFFFVLFHFSFFYEFNIFNLNGEIPPSILEWMIIVNISFFPFIFSPHILISHFSSLPLHSSPPICIRIPIRICSLSATNGAKWSNWCHSVIKCLKLSSSNSRTTRD